MKFPLSPKQLEAFTQSDAKINIFEGAVRSGKSYLAQILFLNMLKDGPAGKYLIAGKTERTIVNNIIEPINEMEPGLIHYNRALGCFHLFGKKVLVVGAHDERAEGNIRGVTLCGALVDELTILPESFFRQLLQRCSMPGAKIFATTNPDSPYHYVKTDFIDSKGQFTKSFKFVLDDNPFLADDFKAFIKETNKGLWYKRFVLGEWVLAEGAIYDFFDEQYHVRKEPPTYAKYYIMGIDYGTKNAFAAVLVGFNDDHNPTLWVEKEYYWDSEQKGYQKTDSEYARDLKEAFEGYPIRMAYLDPSAQSFEIELRRSKIPVKQAKNDVIDGIRFVGSLFTQGDLVICRKCTNVIKEIQSYVWDIKSAKDGIDRPLKQRDHACVIGDTLVLTTDGYLDIESLVNKFPMLISYDLKKYSYTENKAIFVGKTREKQKIFKLTLENGNTLRATGDHQVYTKRGYIEIQNLLPYDEVLCYN